MDMETRELAILEHLYLVGVARTQHLDDLYLSDYGPSWAQETLRRLQAEGKIDGVIAPWDKHKAKYYRLGRKGFKVLTAHHYMNPVSVQRQRMRAHSEDNPLLRHDMALNDFLVTCFKGRPLDLMAMSPISMSRILQAGSTPAKNLRPDLILSKENTYTVEHPFGLRNAQSDWQCIEVDMHTESPKKIEEKFARYAKYLVGNLGTDDGMRYIVWAYGKDSGSTKFLERWRTLKRVIHENDQMLKAIRGHWYYNGSIVQRPKRQVDLLIGSTEELAKYCRHLQAYSGHPDVEVAKILSKVLKESKSIPSRVIDCRDLPQIDNCPTPNAVLLLEPLNGVKVLYAVVDMRYRMFWDLLKDDTTRYVQKLGQLHGCRSGVIVLARSFEMQHIHPENGIYVCEDIKASDFVHKLATKLQLLVDQTPLSLDQR